MKSSGVGSLTNYGWMVFTIAGVVTLCGAYFSSSVGAVSTQLPASKTANTLKVSPVRSDIEVLPGAKKVVQATVTNLSETPVVVKPVANDFVAGDDRGNPALILDDNAYAPTHSLKRFMSPLSPVTIPAKDSKTIDVVISVPQSAQAGGYFGSIRFMPSNPDDGGQVNISPSVASLVLLKVPGATVENLKTTLFSIKQGGSEGVYFQESDGIELSFRFENKGNVQVSPKGKVFVRQGGNTVYEHNFNTLTPADMILPDSARRWEVPLKDIGKIGFYDVVAVFTYGDSNQTLEITKRFYVAPLWLVVAAILFVVLLIGGLVLLVVFISKRAKRRSGGFKVGGRTSARPKRFR